MPLTSLSDRQFVMKDAQRLMTPVTRRGFLRAGASIGSLVMLTGCDIQTGNGLETMLRKVSEMNDGVQAWLFNPETLARTFSEADITRPFPFNAFFEEEKSPEIEAADYELEVGGMVEKKDSWTVAQLQALPRETQITEHICIEGWSAIGKWSGPRFSNFLKMIGADTRAKYVRFRCDDGYSTSLDMATALHPQTQLTVEFDGKTLPRSYGYPVKVRAPTKLGFKNPKWVVSLEVTNEHFEGFWEKYGYNWHSGL